MRTWPRTRFLIVGILPLALAALAAPVLQADPQPANTASKPVPREGTWMKRHEKFVEMAKKGGIDVLFLGDAGTDMWGGEGHDGPPPPRAADLWNRDFAPLKAANFGLSADKTENLLWRLQNGELDGIQPKVVVLLIGTNNTNGNDYKVEEIADAIKAIVQEIHKKSPPSKVLLLGILPRQPRPDDQRKKIKDVNALLAKLDDGGKTVKFLDVGDKFVQPDGSISTDIMDNGLHLTLKGYQILDDALKGPINELLGKK